MATRRKFHRFPGEDEAYAVLTRYGSLPIAGKINDISFGGVGISYLALKAGEGRFSIKLFGTPERLAPVERIKCRVVYNSPIPGKSWGDMISWRSGVEFEGISKTSQVELEQFISSLTAAPIGSAFRNGLAPTTRKNFLMARLALLLRMRPGVNLLQSISRLLLLLDPRSAPTPVQRKFHW